MATELPDSPRPRDLARGRVALSIDVERGELTVTNLSVEPLTVVEFGPRRLDGDHLVPAGPSQPTAAFAERFGTSPGGVLLGSDVVTGSIPTRPGTWWVLLVQTAAGARSWVGAPSPQLSVPAEPAAEPVDEPADVPQSTPTVDPDAGPARTGLWRLGVALAVVAGGVAVTAIAIRLDHGPELVPRTNVVLLVADDMGWADSSYTGDPRFPMPHLESLAEAGVQFSQGYATASICSPSRAAILTGRYPQRFGYEFNPPPLEVPAYGLQRSETILSERLKTLQYKTAAIGKWHLGSSPTLRPPARGFDHFYGYLRGERPHLPSAKATGLKAMRRNHKEVGDDFDTLTDAIGLEAVQFIRDSRRHPFFLYVAFDAVHFPMEALPSDLAAADPSLEGSRKILAAMTAALDRNIGRIVDAVDSSMVAEDTLIIFVNDNGGGPKNHSNNAPYRGQKGRIYEAGHRVAFAMRWPRGIPRGSVYDPVVSTLDIVPTVLAAVGLPITDPMDGVDLLPYVVGEAPEGSAPHDALFWRLGDSWAVRDGHHKLLSDKGGPLELYDLGADPSEQTDLAAADPERVATLQARFDAWNAELQPPAFAGNRDRSMQRMRQRDGAEPDEAPPAADRPSAP